jgi:hypothetical protein
MILYQIISLMLELMSYVRQRHQIVHTESHASTNEDRHGAYATDRRERDDRDFESEHPSRLDRQYHRDEDERRYQDVHW